MNHKKRSIFGLLIVSSLLLVPCTSSAIVIEYRGSDAGAGPTDLRINADTAAASFDAAAGSLGAINIIDFESEPVGFSTPATIDGVTFSFTGDVDTGVSGITTGGDAILGYNTTLGGENFLRIAPAFGFSSLGLLLEFDTAISGFGAYFTGLEEAISGTVSLWNIDGTFSVFNLTDLIGGGVEFLGITDDQLITKILFTETCDGGCAGSRDWWGIDDIRYITASVPEPSALALMGIGLLGMGFSRRRKS